MRVAALFTLVEILGLGIIIWIAVPDAATLANSIEAMSAPAEFGHWNGILLGGILAFYAFIGFEDMVNVAEEVKDPIRNMPLAIVIALVVSTLLYMVVAVVAVASGPVDELGRSDAPLALIYQRAVGTPPVLISAIAMVAVVNGALIQMIMASRVCYGMARQGWIPAWFGAVHPRTQTPAVATLVVAGSILVMALLLPVETLARVTSLLLLVVFALINLALLRIKQKADMSYAGFIVPRWIPWAGLVSSLGFLGYQLVAGLIVCRPEIRPKACQLTLISIDFGLACSSLGMVSDNTPSL